MKKIIIRIILMPIGFIKEVISMSNNGTRDIINKIKYPNCVIGNGCCFTKDTILNKNSRVFNNCIINHSKIGSYTYIGPNCRIQNTSIGNYCSIANDLLCGLGNHPLTHFSTSPLFYKENNTLKLKIIDKDLKFNELSPIHIGSDVWIGARVIILDGVEIGNGAVIAAGAVVTKNVPPYAIVAGVPAKIIKYRVNPQMDDWWNQSPEEIWDTFRKKTN